MKGNRFRQVCWLLVTSSTMLASCGTGGVQPTPTLDRSAAFTAAASTISAELTRSAAGATETAPPTETPTPSATPIPTDTPLPTPTATLPDTPTPTTTWSPTAAPIPGVVFEDDFSSGTGWDEQSGDRFGFGFVDGAYRITVDVLNAPIWSVRNQSFADVRLEVDVARTEGPQDGYYGLVCRHEDGEHYYGLVIGSNGFYGIFKQESDEHEFLVEGSAPEGLIQPGEAVNHVRADCIGENLTLYANGRQLAEVQDDDIEEGDIGLVAGTRLEGGLEVVFDNFVVARP
jgi:hypothetical protein